MDESGNRHLVGLVVCVFAASWRLFGSPQLRGSCFYLNFVPLDLPVWAVVGVAGSGECLEQL